MRPRTFSDEEIFNSMTIVLAKQGFEALTLQNIAVQANVSPAILSKRFGSKPKLLLAYYDYLIHLTESSFQKMDALDLPVVDKLKAIFLQWYAFFKSPKEFANLTFLYLMLDTDPELVAKSKERLRITDEATKKWLREGMDKGKIGEGNVEDLSFLLQASATGAFMIWCKTDGGDSPDVLLDRCFEHILDVKGAK